MRCVENGHSWYRFPRTGCPKEENEGKQAQSQKRMHHMQGTSNNLLYSPADPDELVDSNKSQCVKDPSNQM
jgi:hypothetical protein